MDIPARNRKIVPRRRDRSVVRRCLDWCEGLVARRQAYALIPLTPFDDL